MTYKKELRQNKKETKKGVFNPNFNKKEQPKINPSNGNILLRRYDEFFGNGTSKALLNVKDRLSNNKFIRVNVSMTTKQDVLNFLESHRVKFNETFFENCLMIEKSFFNLTSSLEMLNSNIYMQDLASQVPVNCVDIKRLKKLHRKIKVLDMAASPGSKTTQICDIFNYYGIGYDLIALEPEPKRLTKLINNIQKHEFSNVKVFNVLGQDFESSIKFDVILLDAPCSGNIVSENRWLEKRDLNGINERAKIQKELIRKAVSLLADDGELIYSTCSLEIEENEENVNWATEKLNLKIVDTSLRFNFNTDIIPKIKGRNFNDNSRYCLRFMPYLSGTQGFFVCKFGKKS